VDIDHGLVRTAWKNLNRYIAVFTGLLSCDPLPFYITSGDPYPISVVILLVLACALMICTSREHVVALTPDGRPFPCSLTMGHGMLAFPPTSTAGNLPSHCLLVCVCARVYVCLLGLQSLRPVMGEPLQIGSSGDLFPRNVTFKQVSSCVGDRFTHVSADM